MDNLKNTRTQILTSVLSVWKIQNIQMTKLGHNDNQVTMATRKRMFQLSMYSSTSQYSVLIRIVWWHTSQHSRFNETSFESIFCYLVDKSCIPSVSVCSDESANFRNINACWTSGGNLHFPSQWASCTECDCKKIQNINLWIIKQNHCHVGPLW